MTTIVKSVDTIQIEIETCADGRDYVCIHRSDLKGSPPPIMFPRGDNESAAKFLSSLAMLFGVSLVPVEKND